MELENKVCSRELAKKLKELGVKQESIFYWCDDVVLYKTETGYYAKNGAAFSNQAFQEIPLYSAYTVAELLNILPSSVCTDNWGWLSIDKSDDDTFIAYYADDGEAIIEGDKENTAADALATMLIYIENKLLTL